MHDRYFPMFFNAKEKKIIVIGGGRIALRRVSTMLKYGFDIRLISLDICDELRELEARSEISAVESEIRLGETTLSDIERLAGFDENGLAECFFALICTDKREINKSLGNLFREKGILVNVCDAHDECDFFFPAVAVSDELSVGITGNGNNHSEVKMAAAKIREIIEGERYLRGI